MWVDQKRFAKLLQENEGRIYWRSGNMPECCIVHEWLLIGGEICVLREYQRPDGSLYWANVAKLKG